MVRKNHIRPALPHIARTWRQRTATGEMSLETFDLYLRLAEHLERFAEVNGIVRFDDVSQTLVLAFIEAPGYDRHQGIIVNPANGTRRQRRSAVEALFAEARAQGFTQAAPTVDLPPISRSPRRKGTHLSSGEIQSLRFQSERGMPGTRHAALLALLLAGLHSAEIAKATTDDLDLDSATVWTPGATRTYGRSCPLDSWSVRVLGLRSAHLLRTAEPGVPQRLVTGASSAYRSQASVGAGFSDIARRSGLSTSQRKVEPRDVTRYVARQILDRTGQLSKVARQLGYSSLDSAAAMASLQWLPESGDAA
ncbi:hypothetical protein ACIBI4_14000 [Streptomyces sp. NPDC050418]|uniref:hypothetical protein n=1 Tax=Streptomyces sp. NPDC050418 TaxID=3365612 RepID=UPI0037A34A16